MVQLDWSRGGFNITVILVCRVVVGSDHPRVPSINFHFSENAARINANHTKMWARVENSRKHYIP